MKIILEYYKKILNEVNKKYEWENDFDKRITCKNLNEAKKKLKELIINDNQQLKIIEYHNDEPDNIRKPCKVLLEK